MKEKNGKGFGTKLIGVFIGCSLLIVALFWGGITETNNKGQFQIKQAAITGEMSVRTTPGLYLQLFASIDTWNKAETFFFTADKDVSDDINDDNSFIVRFNDGSKCNVSGTARIELPQAPSEVIALVTDKSYRSYSDVEAKLIRPTIRGVLRSSANLMSAKDSYSTRRQDFVQMSQDQIENGLYKTQDKEVEIKDLVSGEMVTKIVKVIKTDAAGIPLYYDNPLDGTGVTLANFEIKSFDYEPKVQEQISKQQEALMAVQTAKAKAAEAEQNKLTIEAQGAANVAEAKFQEETVAAKQIVQAERDKTMALIEADKKKEQAEIAKEQAIIVATQKMEVADFAKRAAEFTKAEQILLGEGESERKRLVMEADGALELKAKTWLAAQEVYAREFGKQKWVSEINMNGSGGNGSAQGGDAVTQFMNLLSVKAAKDLDFDMSMTPTKKK